MNSNCWLRKYRDVTFVMVILLIMVIFGICLGLKYPSFATSVLPVLSGVITAVGVILANRIHYKMQTPELWMKWNYFVFKEKKTIRVFIEVQNMEGKRIARDTKVMITIKKIDPDGGEKNLEEADLLKLPGYNPLVPEKTPRVENELLPWMVPETPAGYTGLDRVPLKHIANISPGQVNRAPLFDVKFEESLNDYILIVFSEYGTEAEFVSKIVGSKLLPNQVDVKR